jgi:acyl-CoA synthetase (AMP-forming)/AMP-acid ligase II
VGARSQRDARVFQERRADRASDRRRRLTEYRRHLARQEADGALFIVGRTKELIIRSGFNVFPVEVEAVLNAHPGVSQSAVVGRQVEGNEEVVAFVELKPGAEATPASLIEFAARSLAPYKRPAEVIVLPALPASPSGKILKARLRSLLQPAPSELPR